jgi:ligand-binding sensor domain-containing protein
LGTTKGIRVDGSKVTATRAFRDKEGGIWLGTTEGIYHIHGNDVESFSIQDGLSGDFVLGFYEDRENGIWAATTGGVDYFHLRNVTTFSKREGLATDNVDAVAANPDNGVWLNSGDTLDFFNNGHIDALRVGHGLPGRLHIVKNERPLIACWQFSNGRSERDPIDHTC